MCRVFGFANVEGANNMFLTIKSNGATVKWCRASVTCPGYAYIGCACVHMHVIITTCAHACFLVDLSSFMFVKVVCPDTCPGITMFMCLCTYMHVCSDPANAQSLWRPLFSAVLLLNCLGIETKSSPLPLNRPKTKTCQAS